MAGGKKARQRRPVAAKRTVAAKAKAASQAAASRISPLRDPILRTTFDTLTQGIAIFDCNLRVIAHNRAAREMFGFSEKYGRSRPTLRALAQNLYKRGLYSSPAAVDRIEKYYADRLRNRGPATLEGQRSDGKKIIVRAEPTGDGHLVVTYSDVTHALASDARLSEALGLLQATVKTMAQGLAVHDLDFRLIMHNAQYRALFDLPHGLLKPGTTFQDIVRFMAQRGDFGPRDADDILLERELALCGQPSSRSEFHLANGTIVETWVKRFAGGYVCTFSDVTESRQREMKLARASSALQATLDAVSQGIAVLDRDGRITAYNRQAGSIFKLPGALFRPDPSEGLAIGHIAARARGGGMRYPAEIVQGWQKRIRDGVPDRFEIERDDGTLLDVVTTPTKDGGMVATWTDVTEARRRERDLAETVGMLHSTIDSMAQGLAVHDHDLRLIQHNAPFRAIFDLPEKLLAAGTTYGDIIRFLARRGDFGAGDPAEIAHAREARIRGQERVWGQVTLANGKVIDSSVNRFAGGYVCTFTDVTELRQRELQFERTSAALQTTLDAMSQGLAVFDPNGKITAFNRRAQSIFRLPPALFESNLSIGSAIEHMAGRGEYGGRDPAEVKQRWIDRIRAGKPDRYELERKDGTLLDAVTTPTKDGGLVATWTDVTEARRRERKLAETTALLQTTVESMAQGLAVYDRDFRLILHNAQLAKNLNLPDRVLADGATFGSIATFMAERGDFGPVSVAEHVSKRLAYVRRKPRHTLEETLPDGRVIEGRCLPFDGGYVITVTDVTEARQRERVASQNAAVLQATFDAVGQGLAVLDREHVLVAYNRKAAELYGIPGDWLQTRPTIDEIFAFLAARGAFGTADADAIVQARLRQVKSGKPFRWETERRNGPIVDIEGWPMPGGGTVVTYTDVTDARKREKEFASTSAVLRVVLESVTQGISLIDRDMRVRVHNKALRDIYNLPESLFAGEAQYEDITRFLATRGDLGTTDIETAVRDLVGLVRKFETIRLDTELPSGKTIEVRGIPIAEGMVTTYTDVSDRRRFAHELREAKVAAETANGAKSAFLANMSHELRTPLNAIIGYSEAMTSSLFGPLPAKYAEYASDIHRSGRLLLNIVNDLLDLAKVEAGKMALSDEAVDLKDTIDGAMRLVREQAAKSGLTLAAEQNAADTALIADPRALTQMLLNLLSNAIKFTPPCGRIAIHTGEAADGGIELAVADSGIGIAAADLAKIMEPFGQVAGPLNRKHQGTGLGLPLVKALAELHGARLTIDSAPGRGTRIAIVFPRERRRRIAAQAAD